VSFGGATSGIVASEPRAFYTPFVQDPTPPHPLYGGTNRLYRSGNDAVSWSPVTTSALSSATNTEIVGGQDVITAIAVAPSNPSQIYIGYYGGRVFTTGSGSDPWTEVTAAAFPAAPVTWLAVDPQDASRAYVTFSGFGSGAHVFRTTTAGGAWQAIGTGLPAGLPANTISVEPGTAANLWLGTDQGVYKSTNGGDGWTKFSLGLPNAPVYEISIDETHGRVYAATHGRGAFVLGRPFLSNFEGWVHGGIWDIPVYGQNFLPNQSCTLTLLRQDGTVCSTGSVDAMGGTISTDSNGVLVTSLASFYSGKPVAWACFNGKCLNNSDISQCNLPAAPITTVLANCGGQLGIDHVTGCPQISNPPSTLLGLSGLPGAPAAQASEGAETRAPEASLAADQAFDLTASVQAGDGTTRSLCSVRVAYQRGASSDAVLQRAKDALNASPECVAQQVTAEVHPRNDRLGEDDFFVAPKLLLRAPGVSGGQLVTSLHAGPGTAAGTCFELHGIGVPVTNQIEILRLRFETLAGGADGGEIRLHQASGQGDCTLRLPTTPGQSAAEIAQALVNASQATGIPGPHPECPAERNPRDLTFDNGTVITVFSSALAVCLDDPAVGVSVRPEEMPNAHPVADAGPDRVIDCSRQDGLDVTLDGRASSDADSVPGTRSDIVKYEWFEDFGLPGQRALGMGDVLTVHLSLGTHRITLRVTDAAGTSSVDTATIVLRSTPPVFTFVPPAITISSCKRPNIGQATATAPCPVTVTNNAPTVFPLGTTVVTWTARNTAGDVATATQAVTAILGDDASCCPAGSNVVLGTANADVLVGTAARDCILGRGGNDIIVGAGGDDALSGGAGDDTLRGDEGNDQLYGGPGRDILAGVSGNDLLLGGDGDDQLDGGDGNDRLLGEAGNDQLNGGRGTNVLNGGNGTDACQGVRGVDQFVSCESIP
jgi:hypothetical protein